MAKYDYSKRLATLKNRRNDTESLKKAFELGQYQPLNESYEQIKETQSIKYVIGAMSPVGTKYTQNTYAEGDRVKNQLSKLDNIEFKYQGSVTNNTHIKAYSDIDILTIHLGFIDLESPQTTNSPYYGNPVIDLCNLREKSYEILKSAFPAAEVDNKGAKSISLKGGSLKRNIDVVPSNWYNTLKYTETKFEYYRGVMILDYKNKKRLANTPFYHNKLIDSKDIQTLGNYKKMVRLMKTLKADEEKINLSSYDITAIMYHMNNSDFVVGKSPLLLIYKALEYMRTVYLNDVYRNGLKVPDGSRNIFEANGAKKEDLYLMILELDNIYHDIIDDLKLNGSSINKQII